MGDQKTSNPLHALLLGRVFCFWGTPRRSVGPREPRSGNLTALHFFIDARQWMA